MLGEGFHRVERDHLAPGRGADVGVDKAIAQPAFDGGDGGAEGLCDRLGRLAVDLHHPGEGLELVDGIHRRLGDVLGERQRRGHIAILRHEAALDLGLGGEALRGLVRDQLLQRGMAPATGEDSIFAVKLLDQERLEQAQHSDTGLQMGDVLGVIGFRRVAAHIGGMRDEIADSDGKGSKACGHGISFQEGMVWPTRSNACPIPGFRDHHDKRPTLPLRGQWAFIVSDVRGRSPLPFYQSRAIMMVSTRMVVSGLSGASAP